MDDVVGADHRPLYCRAIAHVAFDQRDALCGPDLLDHCRIGAVQVVEHPDLDIFRPQRTHEVSADEACATGNEDSRISIHTGGVLGKVFAGGAEIIPARSRNGDPLIVLLRWLRSMDRG